MTTEVSSTGNTYHPSCFEQVKESKWSDVALITGCVVLLLIAILASSAVFDFMGIDAAAHLSYAMYAGAAFFFLAEFIKVVISRCGKQPDNNSAGGVQMRGQPSPPREWGTPKDRNESQKREIDSLGAMKYCERMVTASSSSIGGAGCREQLIETHQFTSDNYDEMSKRIKDKIDACTTAGQYTSVRTSGLYDRRTNNGMLAVALYVLEPIPQNEIS